MSIDIIKYIKEEKQHLSDPFRGETDINIMRAKVREVSGMEQRAYKLSNPEDHTLDSSILWLQDYSNRLNKITKQRYEELENEKASQKELTTDEILTSYGIPTHVSRDLFSYTDYQVVLDAFTGKIKNTKDERIREAYSNALQITQDYWTKTGKGIYDREKEIHRADEKADEIINEFDKVNNDIDFTDILKYAGIGFGVILVVFFLYKKYKK